MIGLIDRVMGRGHVETLPETEPAVGVARYLGFPIDRDGTRHSWGEADEVVVQMGGHLAWTREIGEPIDYTRFQISHGACLWEVALDVRAGRWDKVTISVPIGTHKPVNCQTHGCCKLETR